MLDTRVYTNQPVFQNVILLKSCFVLAGSSSQWLSNQRKPKALSWWIVGTQYWRLSANAVSDTAGIVMDNFNTAYALTRNILGKGDVCGWSRSGSMCFKLDCASTRNSLLDNLFMFFTSHYRLSWITILKNSMR